MEDNAIEMQELCDRYRESLLSRHTFLIAPEWRASFSHFRPDMRIRAHEETHLMSESDLCTYLALCEGEERQLGVFIGHDICPATRAHNEAERAFAEFCESIEHVTGTDYETLNRNPERKAAYKRMFGAIFRMVHDL